MQKFNEYMRHKVILSYDISMACNLRCEYCYMLDTLDNTKTHDPEMSVLVIKQLAKFKEENPEIELELDILGGEPLMAPNLFGFVEELSKIDIVIWVVTNLMTTDTEKMGKLRQLMELPNVGVACTWHDGVDDNRFKRNLLFMKESMEHRDFGIKEKRINTNFVVSFVLYNDNKGMIEKTEWLTDKGIQYGMTHLYDKDDRRVEKFSEFTDETKEVYKTTMQYNYDFFLDDRKVTTEEFENEELYKVADNYRVVCEPLNYCISYDGKVILSCKKTSKIRYTYHISEGIQPMRIFCEGGDCYCSYYGYKEVHGKK